MFCKIQGYLFEKFLSEKKNVHDINCNWEAVIKCKWLFDEWKLRNLIKYM